MSQDAPEGYIWKKPSSIARWMKRYYAYNPELKELQYWKVKKDKSAGHPSKGSFRDADLIRVHIPDQRTPNVFKVLYSTKAFHFKCDSAEEANMWHNFLAKKVPSSEAKSGAAGQGRIVDTHYTEEEMTQWGDAEILRMMETGMQMTAYFQNNSCKQFRLYCIKDSMYACPVGQSIDKAIIQFSLKKISDIYVGKQTPGFETEIALSVPFDNCFTIISDIYTLDIATESPIIANHWLNGIKLLLTQSGKAVIINEEDEEYEEEDTMGPEAGYADDVVAADAASADGDEMYPAADEDYTSRPRRTALVIVDVQKDYLPGGNCYVKGSDLIVPKINALRKKHFDLVLLTQNWRPENHSCFYETNKDNPKAQLGRALTVNGVRQIMWPTHCVAGTEGAEFADDLHIDNENDFVVQKAKNADADTLSCFRDADLKDTSLIVALNKYEIDDIFLVGVGFDTVIAKTALEGTSGIHFSVYVVVDATSSFSEATRQAMLAKLKAGGIPVINCEDVPDDSLMPAEIIAAARANMEADEDADSGDDAADEPQKIEASAFAMTAEPASEEPKVSAASKVAKPITGTKKGAKKGSKKGSKKGVRIVAGAKKTASGKVVLQGKKGAKKKGAKKGSKKAAKKPAKKGSKKGSKKAAAK